MPKGIYDRHALNRNTNVAGRKKTEIAARAAAKPIKIRRRANKKVPGEDILTITGSEPSEALVSAMLAEAGSTRYVGVRTNDVMPAERIMATLTAYNAIRGPSKSPMSVDEAQLFAHILGEVDRRS